MSLSESSINTSNEVDVINISSDSSENEELSENESSLKTTSDSMPGVSNGDSASSQSRLNLATVVRIKEEPEEILPHAKSYRNTTTKTNAMQDVINVSSDSFENETTTCKRKSMYTSSEEDSSENESPVKKAKHSMPDVPNADSASSQSHSNLVTMVRIKQEPEEIVLPSESLQERTSNVASKSALAEDIIFEHIFKYLAILYKQLIELTAKFEKVSSQLKALVKSRGRIQMRDFTLPDIYLPVSTEEELRKLNEKIKTDCDLSTSLVHYLNNCSDGKVLRTFISDVTLKVVSLKLGKQYNRLGRNGKKPFSEFQEIINVILAAASLKFKQASREKLLYTFGSVLAKEFTRKKCILNPVKKKYSLY